MHHADRDIDLGVANVLRGELLHHAVGDELVVIRGTQPLGHRFESQQKSGEVLYSYKLPRFFFAEDASAVGDVGVAVVRGRERSRMAAAQL